MKQVSDSYRKLRNTLRYLVGSLNDFNPLTDPVPVDQLASIDRYILGKLSDTVREVESAYDEYQFYRANQAIVNFANLDLSAFYLDMAKDRLYISSKDDPRRKSCQTVLHLMLEQLAVLMAPIVPHMSEDVWQNLPYKAPTTSVFQKGWVTEAQRFPSHEAELWDRIRLLRNDVNKCIEIARQAKAAGASQECRVVLHVEDAEFAKILNAMKGDDKLLAKPESTNGIDDLRFILMTSQVQIVSTTEEVRSACPEFNLLAKDTESGATIGVAKALGKKCDRCWYYTESVGEDHEHSDICSRCADVVRVDGYKIVSDPAVATA
jgi:isoleucyl-tRNA synthetase